ncbi:MAG: restriction endonuclease subunit R, partial [Verrucomicrobia bacterium]|nr:restriction endonuclease subunit R [Verrucomicrobiota bacterium]
LLTTYYRAKSVTNKRSIAQVKKVDLDQLPIRIIDFSNPADKSCHDRMVALVEQMLALHKQLAAAKTPQEQTALSRQITATDAQIDRLVYELYGLTAEEIKIVEGS